MWGAGCAQASLCVWSIEGTEWSWMPLGQSPCSMNPVPIKAVPRDVSEPVSKPEARPSVSCTMHPGGQLAVFLAFTTREQETLGRSTLGRSGQLEV